MRIWSAAASASAMPLWIRWRQSQASKTSKSHVHGGSWQALDFSEMNRQLWFTSSRFAAMPGEEEKTNPGRLGQALAEWVKDRLTSNGIIISEDPIPED